MITPPKTEHELIARCEAIAGLTIAELVAHTPWHTPENLLREKGWVGQLLEYVLGADAGSRPVPDFTLLDIELKTLPISYQGKALETTFVCVAPLVNNSLLTWRESGVFQKLKRVLWVPILAERDIPLSQRVIGSPFLWSPTGMQEQALQQDWEELMELITLKGAENITARHGHYLQLRPKAAHGKVLTEAYNAKGELSQAQPKGFYLKTVFTNQILAEQFA